MMSKKIQRTQVDVADGFIDFAIGQPGMDILPRTILQEAAAHRLATNDTTFLNYGFNAGDGYFRIALGEFLGHHYGFEIDPEKLFVTAGSSMALDLVCTRFTKPGDVVLVEQPTYFLAHQIFKDHGLNMVGIPMQSDGIDMNALEQAISEHRPSMVYVIPSFQNPTGYILSTEKRQRLAELSKKENFILVADEVYQLLNFTESDLPPSMASLIDDGNVLSLGTFSKILAPGMRLGWIQCAPELRKKLQQTGFVDSGGSTNHFATAIVRSVIELGLLEQCLGGYRSLYSERVDVMHESLLQELPTAQWQKPTGGFFFWLNMGEDFNGPKLAATAPQFDVGILDGTSFTTDRSLQNFIRLSFAFYQSADIKSGIHRLASAVDSMQ